MSSETSKQKQDNYEIAYRLAAERLCNSDLEYIRGVCDVELKGNSIAVPFFCEEYTVTLPRVVFDPSTLSIFEQILVLHYLTTLESHPCREKYVSFKDLPGASFYNPTYRKRGPDMIARSFGSDIERIAGAAEKIGGNRADYGDVSVMLKVFPRVDAIVVLYRGDEEFPPEVSILYKDDIINFLPLEDIAVVAGLIASRLKKALKD